tara:strand:+ start:1003 stop:1608 length:606 start_codon:yes stop_codon:yes gene_type:complete
MHNLNVLILGPSYFFNSLDELKLFLKFNLLSENSEENPDVTLFHTDALLDKKQKEFINNSNTIKIFAGKKKDTSDKFDAFLGLPASLKEINAVVENIAAKKKFTKNSSIKVKGYYLNKNEKKLSGSKNFIALTEKEVQLIELFLGSDKPISKENILSSVWNYSADTDTHTIETHIYRLRKKITEKFADDTFILNNKDGYYL